MRRRSSRLLESRKQRLAPRAHVSLIVLAWRAAPLMRGRAVPTPDREFQDCRLGYGWMRRQDALDFGVINVLAAGRNQIRAAHHLHRRTPRRRSGRCLPYAASRRIRQRRSPPLVGSDPPSACVP
jgi:hypothetical protein